MDNLWQDLRYAVRMPRLDVAMGASPTLSFHISAFEKPVMTKRRVR